ncbi:nucleotide disphospho-sugar-binding domain-containing protein [Dactylosporangium sp. NPDC049742]|uniref:nucleotide disphospho-sugar-binding domain-containing protein n=1 Tax=Dactylosporangium sp. NPDC049742 TaxID=3154737 RepID=UPI003442BDC9
MRVLFTPYPSVAHLLPIVPLAWAFQSAGHEVRVASHAGFMPQIAATGLTPVPLGDPDSHEARLRDDARRPAEAAEVLRYADVMGLDAVEREHWITFYQYLLNPIADYVRTDLPECADLVAFARAWKPDLVLWDELFYAGPVAAAASGAAHARFMLGPDEIAWSVDRLEEHAAELVAAGLSANPLADVMRPIAEIYGLEVDRELMLGQWTLDPMPERFGPPTTEKVVRMRYEPYSGAQTVPAWLNEPPRRPRVALTLGESTRRFVPGDWDRTPKILEAVAGLDIEVIATLNSLQLQGLESIPDNVVVVDWVPLTQLLPTCSAIIHHGGMGTFAASRAFRVPQLVCDTEESVLMRQEKVEAPTYTIGREFGVREETEVETTQWIVPAKKLEATWTSEYVITNHAGARLNHRALTVEEIGKLILQVVGEGVYQDGANDIYETWLATPAPAQVVKIFEGLVSFRKGR